MTQPLTCVNGECATTCFIILLFNFNLKMLVINYYKNKSINLHHNFREFLENLAGPLDLVALGCRPNQVLLCCLEVPLDHGHQCHHVHHGHLKEITDLVHVHCNKLNEFF